MSGNHHVSAQEIGRVSGFVQGENLLTAPVGRAVQRLSALPWVASVSIHRILPHALGITIEERSPIAVVKTSDKPPVYLLLASGGVIVQAESGPSSGLPLVSGVTLSGRQPGARIVDPRVVKTLAALASTQLDGKHLQQIDFSDPADVTLHGEGSLAIQLGSLSGISDRIDDLRALLDTIDPAEYRSIDMRIGGEATLVPRKVVNR